MLFILPSSSAFTVGPSLPLVAVASQAVLRSGWHTGRDTASSCRGRLLVGRVQIDLGTILLLLNKSPAVHASFFCQPASWSSVPRYVRPKHRGVTIYAATRLDEGSLVFEDNDDPLLVLGPTKELWLGSASDCQLSSPGAMLTEEEDDDAMLLLTLDGPRNHEP